MVSISVDLTGIAIGILLINMRFPKQNKNSCRRKKKAIILQIFFSSVIRWWAIFCYTAWVVLLIFWLIQRIGGTVVIRHFHNTYLGLWSEKARRLHFAIHTFPSSSCPVRQLLPVIPTWTLAFLLNSSPFMGLFLLLILAPVLQPIQT